MELNQQEVLALIMLAEQAASLVAKLVAQGKLEKEQLLQLAEANGVDTKARCEAFLAKLESAA